MLRYYILFDNYEQGLVIHELLDKADIENRISPTPRAIKGYMPCGMSILLKPEDLEAARKVVDENKASYIDIVPVEGQLKSHRDKYC